MSLDDAAAYAKTEANAAGPSRPSRVDPVKSIKDARLVLEGKISQVTRLLAEIRAIGQPLGAVPLLAQVDLLAARLASRPTPTEAGPRLSAREAEVLRLVAAGRSNPGIAQDLSISPRTVTTHLTHIFAKLGVEGRAEAAAFAVRHGLI